MTKMCGTQKCDENSNHNSLQARKDTSHGLGNVVNNCAHENEKDGAGLAGETFGEMGRYLPDTNPKTAVGLTKPGTFAIPPSAMIYLGQAMENGRRKYGLLNWREHAVSLSVYSEAIDRHLMAFKDGENVASDSGVHHLAHVMACCAIVLDAMEIGKLNDDRGPQGNAAEIIARLTKGA